MVGYIHSGEGILAAAVAAAQEVGLAKLTYRLVGDRLGISNRTVVYYFPTKTDLLVAVLETVADKVGTAMATALDDGPLSPEQAFAGMWRALATEAIDPFFRLYAELVGLAAARQAPYDDLMFRIYHQWIDWLEPRMAGPVVHRRAAAAAAYAQVDGLLLVRYIGAPELADQAATWAVETGHVGAPPA